MNCQEGMELMQRYVDHDLNEQETSLLMDHVGQCPECAVMLDKLTRLSKGLEQLPRVEPPFSLVDAILPRLAEDADLLPEAESVSPSRRRAHRPRRAWLARISGVVALGVVVAVFAMNGPFFSGMGSSGQKEASFSADSRASSANSLKSVDQYGKEMPEADSQPFAMRKSISDQAPAAAPPSPSAESRSLTGESGAKEDLSVDGSKNPASAESADRANSMTVDPTGEAAHPPMSIMEFATDVVEEVSPDGQWRAVLTEGKLQIFRTDDDSGKAAYEQAPESGTFSELAWRDDSTGVNYTYTDAEGIASQRTLLVPEMKQLER